MALLDQFLQQRGSLVAQAGQEAEQARFAETSNLRSVGIGALEALNFADEASQNQFLTQRAQEIQGRGGDATDTLEALEIPFGQRQDILQGAVQIAQQAGVLQAPASRQLTAQEKAAEAGAIEAARLRAREESAQGQREVRLEQQELAREEKVRQREESERVKKEEAVKVEAQGAVDLIADLSGGVNALGQEVAAPDLDLIFGREEQFKPQRARSQAGLDLQAKRKRIISLLELGAAGKLKGQGQITEAERRILSDSVGLISDPLISPELAQQEFERMRPIFEKIAGIKAPLTIGRFQIETE